MAKEGKDVEGDVTWWPAVDGERQAIRVDSRSTGGAYTVIESVAQPARRTEMFIGQRRNILGPLVV